MREWSKSYPFVALFIILTGAKHSGFIAVFIAPFILLGLLRRGFLIWKKPGERRLHGMVVAIWFCAVAVVAGAHTYYFHAARGAAEEVLDTVLRYKETNGVYPPSLAEIGGKQGKDGVFYSANDGSPKLFHFATFTPFDRYEYEFYLQRWVFRAD